MARNYSRYPFFKQLLPYLDRLGTDGMSGDESDARSARSTNPLYNIVGLAWRSKEVSTLLSQLNALRLTRRYIGGWATRGAYPRDRRKSRLMDEKSAGVSGLPKNFYDRIHANPSSYQPLVLVFTLCDAAACTALSALPQLCPLDSSRP